MFKPKKVVVDQQTGIPRSWQGPPFFDTAAQEENSRKEQAAQKQKLKERLASETLIGGHAARTAQQRLQPNTMAPLEKSGGSGAAFATMDKLGATGGSKILAPSSGSGIGGVLVSGRRGDVTGLVMGSSSGTHRGAGDLYARKEARMAMAKDIADVKSLPSY